MKGKAIEPCDVKAITHHLTPAQQISATVQVMVILEGLSPFFIAEHNGMNSMEYLLGQAGSSVPAVSPPKLLPNPNCLH